ncbi:MAG: PspC domain-containing protein [Candidatus Bipolaricaulota bacterium]|nr:PspC domain-containing protein [Candidatus Bipolaricaulota bacterium]
MRRLYRSRDDAILGGVCGGIGHYLGVDPTLVRVVFAVLALASGVGVLLYLLLWFVVPREGAAPGREAVRSGAEELAERAREVGEEVRTAVQGKDTGFALAVAVILVFLGVALLLRNLGLWWAWWLRFEILWPLILVAVGVALLWRSIREG